MQKLVLSLMAIFLFSGSALANKLETQANKCGGNFQTSQSVELFTNSEKADIFWTLFPNGSPSVGRMYEKPISIIRNSQLYFFAYEGYESTLFEKCIFYIESAQENDLLRILEISPLNKEIVLKNWSKFPSKLQGWKLVSKENEIILGDIELLPNEEKKVSLEMSFYDGEIELISPTEIVKDRVNFHLIRKNETLCRAGGAFSIFEIETR